MKIFIYPFQSIDTLADFDLIHQKIFWYHYLSVILGTEEGLLLWWFQSFLEVISEDSVADDWLFSTGVLLELLQVKPRLFNLS